MLHAQSNGYSCAACAGCSLIGAIPALWIAFFILHIVLLIWVARDAKARGMDSSVLWMLLVFFIGDCSGSSSASSHAQSETSSVVQVAATAVYRWPSNVLTAANV